MCQIAVCGMKHTIWHDSHFLLLYKNRLQNSISKTSLIILWGRFFLGVFQAFVVRWYQELQCSEFSTSLDIQGHKPTWLTTDAGDLLGVQLGPLTWTPTLSHSMVWILMTCQLGSESILRLSVPRDTAENYKAFYDFALDVPEHHFICSLSVKKSIQSA